MNLSQQYSDLFQYLEFRGFEIGFESEADAGLLKKTNDLLLSLDIRLAVDYSRKKFLKIICGEVTEDDNLKIFDIDINPNLNEDMITIIDQKLTSFFGLKNISFEQLPDIKPVQLTNQINGNNLSKKYNELINFFTTKGYEIQLDNDEIVLLRRNFDVFTVAVVCGISEDKSGDCYLTVACYEDYETCGSDKEITCLCFKTDTTQQEMIKQLDWKISVYLQSKKVGYNPFYNL